MAVLVAMVAQEVTQLVSRQLLTVETILLNALRHRVHVADFCHSTLHLQAMVLWLVMVATLVMAVLEATQPVSKPGLRCRQLYTFLSLALCMTLRPSDLG